MASCPFEAVLAASSVVYQLIHSLGSSMSSFPSSRGAKRPLPFTLVSRGYSYGVASTVMPFLLCRLWGGLVFH